MRFASIVLYTLKLEKAKGYISASTVVLPSKLVLGSQQYNSRQIEPNCCAPLWPSDDDDIDDADDDYGDDDNDDDDSCTSRGDLRNWLRRPELCRVSSSLLYFSLIMLVILILIIIIMLVILILILIIIIISIVVVNIVIIIIICVIVIAALSAVITKGSLLGVQKMFLENISHLFLKGLELGKGEDEGVNA